MNATSPPEWKPKFLSDGKAWLDLILSDDAERRVKGHAWAPDLLLGEIMRYAALNDPGMIKPLQDLYGMLLDGSMPLDLRQQIYRHAADLQQQATTFSANAYLPFIACEPARGISSSAVIDYVSMAPLTAGDPMSRVRDVTAMIERRFPANVGAAFGGLLYLGDDRVCRLLIPLRDELTREEIDEAVKCHTGFVSAATIDFLLDWLEGMDGDAQDGHFGSVASGLVLARRSMLVPKVATGRRPFPFASASQTKVEAMRAFIDIKDYTSRIAPRLRALERTEPEPKVMPAVMEVWGVDGAPPATSWLRRMLPSRGAAAPAVARPAPFRIERSNADWARSGGRILGTWSIFNPNGPTLNCVGQSGGRSDSRIWYRWMHFLGGDGWDLGPAGTRQDFAARLPTDKTAQDPAGYDLAPVTCIPSFVTYADDDAAGQLRQLLIGANIVRQIDWGREIHYLRRYGHDLFGRAGAEMREWVERTREDPSIPEKSRADFIRACEIRYGHVPSFADWSGIPYETQPFDDPHFDEWWDTVTQPTFTANACVQFAQAWVGAASLVPGITTKPGREPTTFEELREFLAACAHPLMSAKQSTASIGRTLGIFRS